ncbi:membrane protease YdiL (CAAX protease family) [Lipingzhangella halophila]|uniref:Membrane protease YdiL (CAAX protease family) n=2 Tax=Lipingzhangella halophila TaxID=1783352 RepID=A0A7W7W6G6_9ACTN|nr:membrane protease YdiL (CAAX protease family) [Lipingzhangella halophila]
MATHFAPTRPHPSAPAADPARTTTLAPRGLTAFFLIAFAFSWTVWWAGSLLIAGGNPMPAVIIGSFGPMVAAVSVTGATQGWSGVGALLRRYAPRRRGGFTPYAIAVVVVLAIAASATFPVFLQETSVDSAALGAALPLLPAQFLLIALAGGGNEELGWRGFALPRLQGALSPLAANLVLGLTWAVWHAPLAAMAGTAQSDMYFPAYALLCVGLTVVLGYIFNSARGGVFATVIAHAAINVVSSLKAAAVGDPAGPGEVALVALVAVVLVVATRGRLGARQPNDAER